MSKHFIAYITMIRMHMMHEILFPSIVRDKMLKFKHFLNFVFRCTNTMQDHIKTCVCE